MNGGMTDASRTFLMTSTAMGALYHVRRCEAGSWIVLKVVIFVVIVNLRCGHF